MSRRTARENLMKLVYEKNVTKEANPLTYERVINVLEDEQKDYFVSAYNGIEENFDFILRAIEKYSNEFSIDRIYKIDLSIMIVALYEILFRDDIPFKVSVNEALELTKVFSGEGKSVSFINGILASIIRDKEAILSEYESADN